MLVHLFKLIWNKKRQNFLLMLEMFVSFIVLFVVFTLSVFYYNNYRKQQGFEYENVWAVNYGLPPGITSKDSINMLVESLRNMISSMPQVEQLSFTGNNIPYSANIFNTSIDYKGKGVISDIYTADTRYAEVLNLTMLSGNWGFKKGERKQRSAVVVNTTLKEVLFGQEEAIGKRVKVDNEELEVTGVVNDFKSKGDYQEPGNGLFRIPDSIDHQAQSMILLKISPDADAAFEAKLYKAVSNFSKNTSVEIEHLSKKREAKNRLTLIPMLILFTVASFLIINVALGLFGVLWYTINRRKPEIGLRRAVGASGTDISGQISGEALVLTTISVLAGCFFAVQFPLLNVFDLPSNVYFAAILLSVTFIYLLVIICSVYPARQAASIYPALALHEE